MHTGVGNCSTTKGKPMVELRTRPTVIPTNLICLQASLLEESKQRETQTEDLRHLHEDANALFER